MVKKQICISKTDLEFICSTYKKRNEGLTFQSSQVTKYLENQQFSFVIVVYFLKGQWNTAPWFIWNLHLDKLHLSNYRIQNFAITSDDLKKTEEPTVLLFQIS